MADIDRFKSINDRFGHDEGDRLLVAVGVAECKPGESMDACIRRADRALYAGKQNGRNRVVCA